MNADSITDAPIRQRRYAVGAEVSDDGRVSVRIWAPDRRRVALVMDGQVTPLEQEPDGYFGGLGVGRAGSRYGFQLDDDPRVYPDPASRYQPDGPHGLSEVIDPSSYRWHDAGWPGITLKGLTLYELHVGTFSAEGTWRSAERHLADLAALGVGAIQMMPVAEFAGEFGWGYDGVSWFAPTHLYGRPDDLRAFVDAAHAHGIAVVLDVVYNHLGPDGNYLTTYARDYFTDRYPNEWGDSLNFDGPNSHAVRELVLANADYWIREYHMDGYRLDAVQQIRDTSRDYIVTALVRRAREAARTRPIVVVGENEPQQAPLLRPLEQGGSGLDALYNDDFHHAARVALTGLRESYYADYRGSSRELLAAARHGFLFQGQRSTWQGKNRGTPALDRPPPQFVHFLENHDQVANSAAGRRLCDVSSPGQLRALTALLLLGPATPLLFQGQEFGATDPFVYFAHHDGELGARVREGRLEFLNQFARFRTRPVASRQRDPTERSTFARCKLTREASERSRRYWTLHRDLLRLRREDPTIALQAAAGLDGADLDDRSFVLRVFGSSDNDRLLVVNLGADLDLASVSEPLVAPPTGRAWSILWCSEHPDYGGSGFADWEATRWPVPGHAAMLLAPSPCGRTRTLDDPVDDAEQDE